MGEVCGWPAGAIPAAVADHWAYRCNETRSRERTVTLPVPAVVPRVRPGHFLAKISAPAWAGGDRDVSIPYLGRNRSEIVFPRHVVDIDLHNPDVG